jgi:hypothetical protein
MTTFNGNQAVQGGYYFSMKSFGVEVVGDEGGTLPGDASAKYVRVPFPALFLIVPVVGLAFLMFLPAIGLYLVAKAIVMKVTGHVAEGATDLAATIAPDHATGAAYLTGKKDGAPAEKSPELEKLEQEIGEKRQ